MYKNTHSYLILNGEKLGNFSTNNRNKVRIFHFINAFQHHTGSPSKCKKWEKEISKLIEKEKIKLSLSANDMIVYIKTTTTKNPWKNRHTLSYSFLELISYYIARLQGTMLICRCQSLSYKPAMNKWNLKLKTQYYLHYLLKT